ncbi:MAG: caspase family protein [Williamsia sp.]|nr:caspase family protein [Williamsia sp.]
MPNLFALLVGVTHCHADSNVASLSGCINDVSSLENYLNNRFSETQRSVVKLLNEQATREAVIQQFIDLFIRNPKIGKDDTVLFYFSGHGSSCRMNPAFEQFDPEKEGTLVLYDMRCKGKFDLADICMLDEKSFLQDLQLLQAHFQERERLIAQ